MLVEHSLDEHTQSLANFLPDGKVFASKNIAGTVTHSLLRGLSVELKRVEKTIIEWLSQYDPRTTLDFILQWERFVGIPDGCFDGQGSLELRRKHVIAKFFARGVSTTQDFIDIAAFLGYTIEIENLPEESNLLPYNVPFNLITGLPRSRFVMVIVGEDLLPAAPPYKVPFVPGQRVSDSPIVCFMRSLAPANVALIFRKTELPQERIIEDETLRVIEDDSTIRITEGT